MAISLSSLLPWLLPPLVGAAIGYITNAIAIRMLFRPLAAKYILKVRIPFTPGIIPRQRGNLAENIARMVSDELLTEDALQRQIQSDRFKEGIERSIASFTDKLLDLQVGRPLLPEPAGMSASEPEVHVSARELFSSFLSDFFVSPTFQQLLEVVIQRIVHLLYGADLKKVLEKIDEEHLNTAISFLTSDRMRERLNKGLTGLIRGDDGSARKINTLLTDEIVDLLCSLLDSLYPSLFSSFSDWLKEDSTRAQLETRGRGLVRDVQEKLSALQRFFISAAQYDRVLDEKMPEIVTDLIRALEDAGNDPENQIKLVGVVKNALKAYGEKTFSGLSGFDHQALIDSLFNFLGREDIRHKLKDFIQNRIDGMESTTIGRFMEQMTGLGEGRVVQFLASSSIQWFEKRGAAFSTNLMDFILSLFEGIEPKSLREFLGIREENKKAIDRFVTQRIVTVLDEKIPEILASFDVRQLVIDKINGLDMENVEKLLLMVIQKHLRWINIFGGILGSIIGMAQVLINRVL